MRLESANSLSPTSNDFLELDAQARLRRQVNIAPCLCAAHNSKGDDNIICVDKIGDVILVSAYNNGTNVRSRGRPCRLPSRIKMNWRVFAEMPFINTLVVISMRDNRNLLPGKA
jgi:hypothetical protein